MLVSTMTHFETMRNTIPSNLPWTDDGTYFDSVTFLSRNLEMQTVAVTVLG